MPFILCKMALKNQNAQTFYTQARRMTTVISLVQKGLEMHTESELLWWWALCACRVTHLHLPNHKRQNWRKKISEVPVWTM